MMCVCRGAALAPINRCAADRYFGLIAHGASESDGKMQIPLWLHTLGEADRILMPLVHFEHLSRPPSPRRGRRAGGEGAHSLSGVCFLAIRGALRTAEAAEDRRGGVAFQCPWG